MNMEVDYWVKLKENLFYNIKLSKYFTATPPDVEIIECERYWIDRGDCLYNLVSNEITAVNDIGDKHILRLAHVDRNSRIWVIVWVPKVKKFCYVDIWTCERVTSMPPLNCMNVFVVWPFEIWPMKDLDNEVVEIQEGNAAEGSITILFIQSSYLLSLKMCHLKVVYSVKMNLENLRESEQLNLYKKIREDVKKVSLYSTRTFLTTVVNNMRDKCGMGYVRSPAGYSAMMPWKVLTNEVQDMYIQPYHNFKFGASMLHKPCIKQAPSMDVTYFEAAENLVAKLHPEAANLAIQWQPIVCYEHPAHGKRWNTNHPDLLALHDARMEAFRQRALLTAPSPRAWRPPMPLPCPADNEDISTPADSEETTSADGEETTAESEDMDISE